MAARVQGMGRGRGRLLRHYLPLLALSALATAGIADSSDSPAWAYRYSLATAFVGLFLFAASLIIGPVALLWRGRPLPISTDLRRDLGILAGIFSLAHVAIGLFVYTDLRVYFLYPVADWQRRLPVRLDDFGTANWTGVAATIILILLLVTSGDWALRRYGARRWKGLQQLAYWAFALVIVHAIIYQRLDPHPQGAFVLALTLAAVSVGVLQGVGYLKADQRLARRARAFRAQRRARETHP